MLSKGPSEREPIRIDDLERVGARSASCTVLERGNVSRRRARFRKWLFEVLLVTWSMQRVNFPLTYGWELIVGESTLGSGRG
jgi:hypothetical protein